MFLDTAPEEIQGNHEETAETVFSSEISRKSPLRLVDVTVRALRELTAPVRCNVYAAAQVFAELQRGSEAFGKLSRLPSEGYNWTRIDTGVLARAVIGFADE